MQFAHKNTQKKYASGSPRAARRTPNQRSPEMETVPRRRAAGPPCRD
ncbi:hypothetical protein C7S17_2471 [Burkholderia thailandensis]|nr:hypothetical protein [Burkholderia thailandensis]